MNTIHPPEVSQRARDLRATGLSYAKIAVALGVHRHTVIRWTGPPDKTEARRKQLRKLNREHYARKTAGVDGIRCPDCREQMIVVAVRCGFCEDEREMAAAA